MLSNGFHKIFFAFTFGFIIARHKLDGKSYIIETYDAKDEEFGQNYGESLEKYGTSKPSGYAPKPYEKPTTTTTSTTTTTTTPTTTKWTRRWSTKWKTSWTSRFSTKWSSRWTARPKPKPTTSDWQPRPRPY